MISVIIPCKNEKGTISDIVRRMSFPSYELMFVVDGCSTDGTLQEIIRLQEIYSNVECVIQTGRGKANAVIEGLSWAKGDVLVIYDGDMTVLPEDIPGMVDQVREDVLVIGERVESGRGAFRFLNLIANQLFAKAWSWITGYRIADTLCGTKILMKSDWKKMTPIPEDPFLDFTLLHEARRLRMRIIPIPVHYYARCYGKTKIHRFRHGILLAWITIKSVWELGEWN
jgi:glycosyltransferase involved in cell wall biosynthesis